MPSMLEVDSGVTTTITRVPESETGQLLACMKAMIGLERIGDLLLSFATSAQAAGGRLDSQDARDLTQMATVLEKMLADVGVAFSERDVKKAIEVLRADAEMDRLRNIIFLRHIENPENVAHHSSLQVIFMTQSSGASRRSRQESGGRSLPLRQRTQHPASAHGLRQAKRADVHRLAAAQRRKSVVTLVVPSARNYPFNPGPILGPKLGHRVLPRCSFS